MILCCIILGSLPPVVWERVREREREYEQECVVNETRAETGAPCTHLSALHTQF